MLAEYQQVLAFGILLGFLLGSLTYRSGVRSRASSYAELFSNWKSGLAHLGWLMVLSFIAVTTVLYEKTLLYPTWVYIIWWVFMLLTVFGKGMDSTRSNRVRDDEDQTGENNVTADDDN